MGRNKSKKSKKHLVQVSVIKEVRIVEVKAPSEEEAFEQAINYVRKGGGKRISTGVDYSACITRKVRNL